MPPKIERNPDGSATDESWQRHYEAEKNQIAKWDCDIKLKTQPVEKNKAQSTQNSMKKLNEYLHVDHWIAEACKEGEPCLNTTSIVIRNAKNLPVELTDIVITNSSAWRITAPNAFPVRIPAGETYIITKELISSSFEPADGGLVTIKLNDGSAFTSH